VSLPFLHNNSRANKRKNNDSCSHPPHLFHPGVKPCYLRFPSSCPYYPSGSVPIAAFLHRKWLPVQYESNTPAIPLLTLRPAKATLCPIRLSRMTTKLLELTTAHSSPPFNPAFASLLNPEHQNSKSPNPAYHRPT